MEPHASFDSPVISPGAVTPFIGVYDVFSASVAGQRYANLFLSGFGFAASHYGLPDVGFITWTDIVGYVQRIQTVLPRANLLVDIDDGYGDPEVACHVTRTLDRMGIFGIVLEDQQRPRRCGHVAGKQVLPLDDYLRKLERVLHTRSQLFVIARTDASEPSEVLRRVRAFRDAGADAVLADGIVDLSLLGRIRREVDCPVAFNQLAGGKSPVCDWGQLEKLGVSIVIYSTPCLFAAQRAIETALDALKTADGSLETALDRDAVLTDCNQVLNANLPAKAGDLEFDHASFRINGGIPQAACTAEH